MTELDSYLEQLANAGYAPSTIRLYRLALRRFTRWLEGREPTGAVVNAYVRYLQTELALRPRTVRPAMAAIKGYLKYLHDRGEIAAIPAAIRLPPLDAPDSYCPTDTEMERIWIAAEALPQKTAHQRYLRRRTLTILALIAWAGLRHSELQALDVDDIDLEKRTLRIRCGKGGKTDWLPLSSPDLRDYLAEWLKVRGEWVAEHQPWPAVAQALFHVDRRRRIGDRVSRTMWDDLNRRAQPAQRVTDHSIRRYYGTTLDRRGIALADVSRLMRHKSIVTTFAYLKWDTQSISDAAATLGRSVHPREPEPPRPAPRNSPPRASEGGQRRDWLRRRRQKPGPGEGGSGNWRPTQ